MQLHSDHQRALVWMEKARNGQIEADEYIDLIRHLSQTGIAGGATYDAVVACAAAKAQVDHILTLNSKDFQRVYPALAASVITP